MRILIVGATGALGRDVVKAAVRDGHDTAAPVRDPVRAELPQAVELVATCLMLRRFVQRWRGVGQR